MMMMKMMTTKMVMTMARSFQDTLRLTNSLVSHQEIAMMFLIANSIQILDFHSSFFLLSRNIRWAKTMAQKIGTLDNNDVK